MKRKKPGTVRPNCGIEAEYRERLRALVREMHESVLYWLRASYRAAEPATVLASDEAPVAMLRRSMRLLGRRWLKRFDEAAPKLGRWFATDTSKRSDAALRKILRDGGLSVEFKMTAAARDVMRSTIEAQVSLIKSIPRRYLTDVEGMVMRSVQAGRDLGTLTKEIESAYGVTRRRAALIARDQNNKATASMTRVRQVEIGVTEATWVHSGGGRHPRPSHVKAARDGVRYDVRKGWYDPDEKKWIFPGELVNCRCVSRPMIPGFS